MSGVLTNALRKRIQELEEELENIKQACRDDMQDWENSSSWFNPFARIRGMVRERSNDATE